MERKTRMKMGDILSLHYEELKGYCRDNERLVSEGRTDEDWLNDIALTALNKYGDQEIEEEEGMAYLKKSLLMALKFKFNKKDKRTVYLEDLE